MFTDDNELYMGNIYDKNVFCSDKFLKIQKSFFSLNKIYDKKCNECLIQNICSGCLGMNYFENNQINNYNENYCNMNIKMAEKVILNLAKYYNRINQSEVI
jgi:uncharacterized protein